MPRNSAKRRCSLPGCRAWALRSGEWCAAHARARALQARPDLVLPLLQAVAHHPPLGDDLAVIEEELSRLYQARQCFVEWIEQARAEQGEGRAAVTPAQFLRAWNDSTARVVQLLRARRELTASKGGQDSLFDAVYDALEAEWDKPEPKEPA